MSPRRSPDESPDASAGQVASPLSPPRDRTSRGRLAPPATLAWVVGAVTVLLGLVLVRRCRRSR